jgi:hypothetical protein
MEKKYELVFCIINAGFADTVMFAARKAGASGGTVLKGRGVAGRDAQEKYKITIQPEKEVVMLLVPKEIKDDVLRYIYDFAGLNTESQGIAFSLPVEKTVGLKDFDESQAPEANKKEK